VWNVTDGRKDLTFHPRGIMWFSTPLLVRDAVRAGAGAALLPRSVIAEELASGQLVSWGTAREGHVEAWVLHASRRLVSPKVSAFVGYLCDYYANMAAV
jgi:DNA-binding transcriptional LysR family regulator